LVGIAGGLGGRGVRLGDVLVAKQIVDYERQRIREGKLDVQPRIFPTDVSLQRTATECGARNWQSSIKFKNPDERVPTCISCLIASGDKFVEDPGFLKELCFQSPELRGVEMEAGGVALACAESPLRPHFLMIRGVSDLADSKDAKMPSAVRKAWKTFACHVAASFAVGLVQRHAELEPETSPASDEAPSSTSFASPEGDACLLGAAPWRRTCCRCRGISKGQYDRWPRMSQLVSFVAKLCRRRSLLTICSVGVVVLAILVYLALRPANLGIAGSAILGLLAVSLGLVSVSFMMTVAEGLALKSQIMQGIASEAELDRFLALADGVVFLPNLRRRVLRREE
jgi:nucleoside phosphorylase